MVHFWFQGSVQGEEKSLHRKIALASESVWSTLFSRNLFAILKTLLLDVILQRRLLQESVKRWFIHSLIFLPILFRFLLSVFTFFVSRIGPDSSLGLILIDKNSPFMAFVNDLCGILILLGIVLGRASASHHQAAPCDRRIQGQSGAASHRPAGPARFCGGRGAHPHDAASPTRGALFLHRIPPFPIVLVASPSTGPPFTRISGGPTP
jgi:hypothetical protein